MSLYLPSSHTQVSSFPHDSVYNLWLRSAEEAVNATGHSALTLGSPGKVAWLPCVCGDLKIVLIHLQVSY